MKAKKRSDSVADLNKIWEKGADSDQLRDELIPCQNFITDIMVEMDATKYVISTFELNPYLVDKKLDQVIEKLDCSAIVNIALGFALSIIETDEDRYFWSHEINTFFDKSDLTSI